MTGNKKKKNGIIGWSIGTVFCAVLLIAALIGSNIAFASEQALNIALQIKTNKVLNGDDSAVYFASDFNSVEELETHDKLVAEQLTGEGAVLLMNKEDALPLSGQEKVSLFSHSSVDIATCGTGSADIDTSNAPTLKQALEEEGFTVNPALWDFYTTGAGKDYNRAPVKGMNGLTGGRASYHVNEVPADVYTDEVTSSFRTYNDVAIVTITRVSGEMFDMPVDGFVDGTNSLELTQEEKDMLQMIEDGGFKKTIVLINSTNPIECDFLTEGLYGIDAALWIGYTGTWGLNAVADILSGQVNPSGRLVDTYCNDNTTAPAMVGFYGSTYANAEGNDDFYLLAGGLDSNQNYIVYQEGIYVGYRYYETRYEDTVLGQGNTAGYDYTAEVAYPFGYGLSYTDFEWSDFQSVFQADEDRFEIHVTVTNRGNTAGKEVVQVYFQSPYTQYDKDNSIEKAAVELCGFAKTQLLEPGASETVSIIVPREELAAYDRLNHKTYILDAGNYYLTAAGNAHAAVNNVLAAKGYTTGDGMDAEGNADFVLQYHNAQLDNTTYAQSSATGYPVTNQFDDADLGYYGEDITYLSRSDWQSTWPVAMELSANEQMMEDLVSWQTYAGGADPDAQMPVMGADNNMTLAMMIGKDYEDPDWEKLLDQVTYEEMATLIGKTYHNTVLMNSVSKPATLDDNGPQGFTQTLTGVSTCHCAYSDENIMAATYNVELMEEVGRAIGNDMLDLGASGLYGPAMNIHRTAYSGRNFEYYSEDGFLSGKIAAAEVKGIQSKGVYVYIKHYAFNDSETNCRCISTFMNEQAARELYLKPFEMAIVEGNAMNVMNSFSRVGTVWSGAHYGLMTEVLRNEWGMDGFSITDFSGNSMFASYGILLRSFDVAHGLLAGTNTWDSSAAQWTDDLMKLYQNDASIVNAMRESTHRVLYTVANSHAMNGFTDNTTIKAVIPWWKPALIALDVLIGLALAACAFKLVYNIRRRKAERKITAETDQKNTQK